MSNYTRPLQICEFNKHGCIIWTLETVDANLYFFIKLRIWPTADAYMFFVIVFLKNPYLYYQ